MRLGVLPQELGGCNDSNTSGSVAKQGTETSTVYKQQASVQGSKLTVVTVEGISVHVSFLSGLCICGVVFKESVVSTYHKVCSPKDVAEAGHMQNKIHQEHHYCIWNVLHVRIMRYLMRYAQNLKLSLN